MTELPKTEAELQGLIDEAVNKATTALKAEYDGKFATQRTKHDQEIKKLKEDMGKSAEELAQERIKEQQEKDANELTELRAFKKNTILGEKLAKEGLPSYFKNDNRLLTAEDGDLDRVIKDVKKEYEATLPKGNTHSSVVQQGGSVSPNSQKSEADIANEKMGEFLNNILKK